MAEKKKQTYAQAIAELEEIVAKLQNNECEIDELKTYTNRSLSLLKFCKDKLFETDEEIKKCWKSSIHNIGNANSTVFAIIKYRKSKKRVNFVP